MNKSTVGELNRIMFEQHNLIYLSGSETNHFFTSVRVYVVIYHYRVTITILLILRFVMYLQEFQFLGNVR